jgi:hypothetical protein
MKTLVIETTKGTRTYALSPKDGGFNVHKSSGGFFGASRKLVGHGSSLENAVFIARLDAGDSTVRSTRLKN